MRHTLKERDAMLHISSFVPIFSTLKHICIQHCRVMLYYDCVTFDCTEKNQEHLILRSERWYFHCTFNTLNVKYYCVITSSTPMPSWPRQRFQMRWKYKSKSFSVWHLSILHFYFFLYTQYVVELRRAAKLIANRSDFRDNKAKLKNIDMRREHRFKSIYCSSSNSLNSNKSYHLLIHTTL